MKKLTLIIATFAGTLAMAAQAKHSTPSEHAGYNNCLTAGKAELNGLVPARSYFLSKASGNSEYYINGTAWEKGDRVPVRLACTTSTNGRKLLNLTTNTGRYALDVRSEPIRVASQ